MGSRVSLDFSDRLLLGALAHARFNLPEAGDVTQCFSLRSFYQEGAFQLGDVPCSPFLNAAAADGCSELQSKHGAH